MGVRVTAAPAKRRMKLGVIGKHDSPIVLMFLLLPAARRREVLRQYGTLDEVPIGEWR